MSKKHPSTNLNKTRLLIVFAFVCILATLLAFRVGWIQIIRGEEYAEMAIEQQTSDVPITAKRGVIYDRNGKELAISAVTHTIWVRPASLRNYSEEAAEVEENTNNVVMQLAEILEMDVNTVKDIVTQEKLLVKVAKYVDKDKADKIRDAQLTGIEIAEDVKRYYPLGAFLSHVLGSTTDDNQGLSGLELKYNQYLSGIDGRWIKNKDIAGRSLAYGVEKYYQAEDGLSLVLTIDEVIQHYVEKAIGTVQANTQAKRVLCLVMDPRTGDVLAMAVTPDFDPNDPRTPLDPVEAEKVAALTNAEKQTYWNQMWRNPLISDTYEPGSTFKLVTTSLALDAGVTHPSELFTCTHSYKVAGVTLHCWRPQAHGVETLEQAVQNSCNPVFIQLAQRMGLDKYYEGLELFGLTDKTGIDFPGEGSNILQKKDTAGPVGLATMSYGQGIAVTPINLLTAVSAIGNDGKLMQPRLVKELVDSNGNVVETFEPEVVRQVISKQTADEMCEIMESVVSEGGGGNAKVAGYRIGGKTGTANKPKAGGYSEDTYSSFIGLAPMDDPQVAILLIVDTPVGVKYGSTTAAPGVKMILEDTLRYLNIQPTYTEEELKAIESNMVTVPDLTGESVEDALGILGGQKLKATLSLNQDLGTAGEVVVDQYPKPGERVEKNSTITVYYDKVAPVEEPEGKDMPLEAQ